MWGKPSKLRQRRGGILVKEVRVSFKTNAHGLRNEAMNLLSETSAEDSCSLSITGSFRLSTSSLPDGVVCSNLWSPPSGCLSDWVLHAALGPSSKTSRPEFCSPQGQFSENPDGISLLLVVPLGTVEDTSSCQPVCNHHGL